MPKDMDVLHYQASRRTTVTIDNAKDEKVAAWDEKGIARQYSRSNGPPYCRTTTGGEERSSGNISFAYHFELAPLVLRCELCIFPFYSVASLTLVPTLDLSFLSRLYADLGCW